MNSKEREINEKKRKALSYLGFASRARRVSLGADQVISAIRRSGGRDIAVIVAFDASDRTKKQINDKCASYAAPMIDVSVTGDELSRAVGKDMTLSCVACTDKDLASALVKLSGVGEDIGAPQKKQLKKQLEERIFPLESGKR